MIAYNFLYKDIEINYQLLNIWINKFISFYITNNIVNYNFNHYKCLSYIANICENNHKYNFYAAIADTKIKKTTYIAAIYIIILVIEGKI